MVVKFICAVALCLLILSMRMKTFARNFLLSLVFLLNLSLMGIEIIQALSYAQQILAFGRIDDQIVEFLTPQLCTSSRIGRKAHF